MSADAITQWDDEVASVRAAQEEVADAADHLDRVQPCSRRGVFLRLRALEFLADLHEEIASTHRREFTA